MRSSLSTGSARTIPDETGLEEEGLGGEEGLEEEEEAGGGARRGAARAAFSRACISAIFCLRMRRASSVLALEWSWGSWGRPEKPERMEAAMSATEAGVWGTKMVFWFLLWPRSLRVSKYWVMRTRSMTSLGSMPCTTSEKWTMESRRPPTMALRWLATPTPERYLLSASASAALTMPI